MTDLQAAFDEMAQRVSPTFNERLAQQLFESPGMKAMLEQQNLLAAAATNSIMKGLAASLLQSGVLAQLEEISRSYVSSTATMLREAVAAGGFGADFESMYGAATRAAVLHVRTAVDGVVAGEVSTAASGRVIVSGTVHEPAVTVEAEALEELLVRHLLVVMAVVALVWCTVSFGTNLGRRQYDDALNAWLGALAVLLGTAHQQR
jgi:hypothetical protein